MSSDYLSLADVSRLLFPMRDLDDDAEEMIPPPNTYAPFHRMNTQVEQGLKRMVKEEDSHLTEVAAKLNGAS